MRVVSVSLPASSLRVLHGPGDRLILEGMKLDHAATRRHLPNSPFNRPAVIRPVKEFAVEDLVTHDRYGLGRVLRADETGVLVDFGTQQERIAAPYTKLTKL